MTRDTWSYVFSQKWYFFKCATFQFDGSTFSSIISSSYVPFSAMLRIRYSTSQLGPNLPTLTSCVDWNTFQRTTSQFWSVINSPFDFSTFLFLAFESPFESKLITFILLPCLNLLLMPRHSITLLYEQITSLTLLSQRGSKLWYHK